MKILSVLQVFSLISSFKGRTDLGAPLSYRLLNLYVGLNPVITKTKESLNNLANQYGTKDKDGQLEVNDRGELIVELNKQAKYNTDYQAIVNQEVQVPDIKIPVSIMNPLALSMEQMAILYPFILDDIS